MIWENEWLAGGIIEYIKWLIFLGVWLFALNLFAEKYAVDELRNTREIIKQRLYSFMNIVFFCGLISIKTGAKRHGLSVTSGYGDQVDCCHG